MVMAVDRGEGKGEGKGSTCCSVAASSATRSASRGAGARAVAGGVCVRHSSSSALSLRRAACTAPRVHGVCMPRALHPCTCRAHAVHMPCTCRAHAVHMPCTCRAHAVHMPCTCRAHAVHMPCTCLRDGAPERKHRARQHVLLLHARSGHATWLQAARVVLLLPQLPHLLRGHRRVRTLGGAVQHLMGAPALAAPPQVGLPHLM
jgi:hypothetical protein